MMPPKPKSAEERFWAKVAKSDGCWEWQGATNDHGYGVFGKGQRGAGNHRAHRFSYELHYGPLPDIGGYHGAVVLHKCDNPRCVRPDHLAVGSQAENMRDASSKGRCSNQKVTHCPLGHEYTPENTIVQKHRRGRVCKTCYNARRRRWRAEQLMKQREAA